MVAVGNWLCGLVRVTFAICALTARSKTDARKRGFARLLTPFNADVRPHGPGHETKIPSRLYRGIGSFLCCSFYHRIGQPLVRNAVHEARWHARQRAYSGCRHLDNAVTLYICFAHCLGFLHYSLASEYS